MRHYLIKYKKKTEDKMAGMDMDSLTDSTALVNLTGQLANTAN